MKRAPRLAARLLLGIALAAALPSAAFFAVGPERVWTHLVGSGDQGPADVRAVTRRATPNDALACTPSLCRARADIVLPPDARSPAELLAALDAIALSNPGDVTRVDDGSDPLYRRYVERTPIMRYPDTIDALAAPVAGGTGLALYSRSQIGSDDWGVNRGRLEGWLERLGRRPAAIPVATSTPVS